MATLYNAARPDFMEPLPQYVRRAAPEPYYEEEDEGELCYCNGCSNVLSPTEYNYCYDCVDGMDQEYAEKKMNAGSSCSSCGGKFKETEVGIRCKCELMTHGRYMAHGR